MIAHQDDLTWTSENESIVDKAKENVYPFLFRKLFKLTFHT